MREVLTRILFQASPESILTQARLMITPEHLVSCSPTYEFALYQLLINKGIQISAPSAVDDEEGIQAIIYNFLFPSTYATLGNPRTGTTSAPRSPIRHVGTPQSLIPCGLEGILDRQPNSGPRGPSHKVQLAFSDFDSRRAAQNQEAAQVAQTQRPVANPI